MLRLSSISSQDSGFTSQDTLFLRAEAKNNSDQDLSSSPGSSAAASTAATATIRHSVNPVVSSAAVTELTDRPHTISSAYEKGHQRPQLQPYTFAPPIQEEQEGRN